MMSRHTFRTAQRGAVLLLTLISLVILLIAATALFRSVDTATLIASNLALRQSAIASSDRAVTAAVNILSGFATSDTNSSPWTNPSDVFNQDAAPYYTNAPTDPNASGYLDLTAASTWVDGKSSSLNTADASGNQSRYIIQRMCRSQNALPTAQDCLLNYTAQDNGSHKGGVQQAQQNPSSMVFRITVRTIGPKNTVSYIQAFVN